jgi:hypothetical protein
MFSKKVSVLATLAVIALIANVSSGAWVYWTNGSANQQWTDTGNWTAYPTSSDDVVVGGWAANGPIISTGQTGYANWMHICESVSTGSKLTIDGGTLNVADHLFIGQWDVTQKGTLQINSGTVNTTLLMCGGDTDGSKGDGTLLMNGGTINISWLLAVAGGYSGTNGAGIGHIQLDAGTVNVTGGGGLVMSSSGSIDITGGALKLNGTITDITTYGDVTAYGGAGSFVYSYDGGRTTITAIPEPATLAIIGLGSLLLRRKKA